MHNVSHAAAEETRDRGTFPIIFGFSARALAEAVVAWGSPPVVIDHFTDQDCRELAFAWYQIVNWGSSGAPLARLLDELAEVLPATSAGWVLLGGGTENWPEMLAELHQRFDVLGPNTEQLAILRNYLFWQQAVLGSGVRFPRTELIRPQTPLTPEPVSPPSFASPSFSPAPRHPQPAPKLNRWLWKPIRGAGGVSIRSIGPEDEPLVTASWKPGICQQRIDGRSLGAHCILAADKVQLLGMTEAWTSDDWPGPNEFIYRGARGPISITEVHSQQILAVCCNIQRATGYVGWLQLDFIEDAAGQLWLLEINPRWAAGMELLLLAGINPVVYHLAAWQGVARLPELPAVTAQYGKAVVYAERTLQLTADGIRRLHGLSRSAFADLPSLDLAGKTVAAGQPLLTVRTGCELGIHTRDPRSSLLAELRRLRGVVFETLESQT